ncbi:esterase/lipase family protein [Halobacillus seohaensis]|uniref:Esterase/lipase family protein n=1 Tax=Halobacillus seohaensis TaxID=447421 RepID=A0ABW2ENR8_9BACI
MTNRNGSLPVTYPFQADKYRKNSTSGTPGQWYKGTVPPYVAPSKRPIVFIHGINSSSHTWWNGNDMYEIAYFNGFKTAFIDLHSTLDMWDNGRLLASKLEEIYQHFNEKLIVVAHSKGGIDTQSAMIHYEAIPYVAKVINLSVPHQGSELADLAFSTWAGWLADIIGNKNEAIKSLQTGYMDYFRSKTDSCSMVDHIPFYTLSGTGWGSFGSSLYWGGLYLSSYGENDGAITVERSRLPYTTELRVSDWNHSEIIKGHSTFHLFADHLYESSTFKSDSHNNRSLEKQKPSAHAYFHGGSYRGETTETFFVENDVNTITVNWMSEHEKPNISLISPGGSVNKSFIPIADSETIFKGTYHHMLTIHNPTEGVWKIKALSNQEHYLLGVHFDSAINRYINLEVRDPLQVGIASFNTLDNKKMMSTIYLEYYKADMRDSRKLEWQALSSNSFRKIPNLGEGIYNITMDLKGKTPQDKDFNRSIVASFYLDSNGEIVK